MTLSIPLTRHDRILVSLAFLIGALALPWLPGPYLPASSLIVGALAFLLPITALSVCVGQSVLASRTRSVDGPSRASAGAVATATTALCSFTMSLHYLVLTTLTDAPFQVHAPARVAVILFGLHLAVVGNVLPRLRPGWPVNAAEQDVRHRAWMHVHRTVGYVGVVAGIAVATVGSTLTGRQIDTVLKIGFAGAALCIAWSLRRIRAA